MTETPIDFINIFVHPPGDLLYYLVVIAVTQVSFFMALGQRLRRRGERAPTRYTIATLGVVITWAMLMVGALFTLLSGQPANAILPPMERVAHVVTILLIGWAFLTADHELWDRGANMVVLALLVLVVLGYIFTGMEWSGLYQSTEFNRSTFGMTWAFIPAVLAIVGVVLAIIYFRWITDAPLKAVYFGLMLVGSIAALTSIVQGTLEGDYVGVMRLTFLASLLIVPVVIYRVIVGTLEAELDTLSNTEPVFTPQIITQPAPPKIDASAVSSNERDSAQLMRALGMILERATLQSIPERIVASAITALKADMGVLMKPQDANYAEIIVGSDKFIERKISTIAINLDDQPTLVNAIERRAQRPLYPDRNDKELSDLYSRLDIDSMGATYFQPLVTEKEVLAILMIGMPYTRRELSDQEQELLKGIGIIAANLLALSYAPRDTKSTREQKVLTSDFDQDTAAIQQAPSELDAAHEQIVALSSQIAELTAKLDEERNQVAAKLSDSQEGLSVSQRIVAITADQERLRDERDQLATQLRDAETMLAGVGMTDNEAVFKTLIDNLNRDREALVRQRDRLHEQINDMRTTQSAPLPHIVQEMIERMGQEKGQLEVERDRLQNKLGDLESQLTALGVEGGAGLTQLVGQLYEQRANLQAKNESIKSERDALAAEQSQYQDAIRRESERDTRLQKLENDIKNLASDREAALKQRDRAWGEREELLFGQEELRAQANRLLTEAQSFENELLDSQAEAGELRTQVQGLADQISTLMSERDRLVAELSATESEKEGLMARVEGDRDRIAQLGADGVGSLTRMIDTLSSQRAALERQLHESALALAGAEDRIQMLQIRADATPQIAYQTDNPEVILGMLQELRTPLTSIVGYVDLVLNESAGILGEMQHKFLQRVSANVSRLSSMIDDLVRITFLDAGRFVLKRHDVDVIALIEDALTNATQQLREKGLTVHLNLQDDLPPVRGDLDALTQVIAQLLTNAYLVSASGRSIYITARRYQPKQASPVAVPMGDSLFISIEDRGGGIPQEEQSRVFARKYKAENPLIQGLGDTGVSLAIAKALVEAHGGAIWFDTVDGVGSTFSLVLPFEGNAHPLNARNIQNGRLLYDARAGDTTVASTSQD